MCIKIRVLNITKKYIRLVALIESLPKKPDIIAVNEIFARDNEDGPFNNLDGYKYVPNCRKDHAQGGVALYIKYGINFSLRLDLSIMDEQFFESIFVDLHFKSQSVTIGTIYRSPDETISSQNRFLHHLRKTLNIIDRNKTIKHALLFWVT